MVRQLIADADCEIREVDGAPRLSLTLIQEGRMASRRAELFAPGSVQWGADGVAVRVGHGNPEEVRAMPARLPGGEIRVSARATERIVEAVHSGVIGASVEFYALQESRNGLNIREIQRALVSGVAIVSRPEYTQGKAELRSRERRNILWRV